MSKFIKTAIWIVFAIPAAYLAILWNKLPERIAMHYNLKGEADRFGDKTELMILVAVITAINIGIYFLLVNINRIDPKKKFSKDNLPRMRNIAFFISIFMSAVACFLIYNMGKEEATFNPNFLVVGIGILFTILGNYFYSIKPNYFAGLRTPWALENENNWRLTHQLGGKLWFVGGLAIVVAGLLLKEILLFIALMIIILVMVVIPIAYSYRLYKKEKNNSR